MVQPQTLAINQLRAQGPHPLYNTHHLFAYHGREREPKYFLALLYYPYMLYLLLVEYLQVPQRLFLLHPWQLTRHRIMMISK